MAETETQTPTPAAPAAAPAGPSVADLKAQMAKAIELEDYAQVAQVARLLKAAQTAEREAKDALTAKDREALTQKLFDQIGKIVGKFQDEVVKLVGADRAEIQYTWSPEKGNACHIMKAAPKAAAPGEKKPRTPAAGGAGGKGGPSSEELLTTYGAEVMKPDAKDGDKFQGLTFQQAWDASSDKNSRFSVRVALLKRHTAA